MFNMEIVKIIELGKNGGETLLFEDVDNDGEKEMIFRQSGGTYHAESHRNIEKMGKDWVDDENHNLLQYTCLKQDGTIVWQNGKPWSKERPYNSHGSSNMSKIIDIDGDGKKEIIYLFKDWLYILDAATGTCIKSKKVESDVLDHVFLQRSGSRYNIVLKNGGDGPFGYGKLMVVYDSDLNLLWRTTEGNGHFTVLKDMDEDGKDEIFEGYTLFDDDGKVIWTFEHPSHVDHISVEDINGDGVDEVIYCTDNDDMVMMNVKGEILMKNSSFIHPQKTCSGKFMKDVPGLQIFLNNHAAIGNSLMLDCKGSVLWDFPCNGYARTIRKKGYEMDLLFFSPNPGRLPQERQMEYIKRALELGYENLPISGNSGFEPFIMDGYGKIIYKFPFIEESIDISKWGLPVWSKVDHGAGFNIMIEDVDNDGEDEYIFHTRSKVWIFKDKS